MTITLNTLAYEQDGWVNPDLTIYRGPAATSMVKDLIALGRTRPTPTADFDGISRSRLKRTKTLTLTNGLKHEATFEVLVGIPVGAVTAEVDALRDDIGDLVISAVGAAVVNNHDITH